MNLWRRKIYGTPQQITTFFASGGSSLLSTNGLHGLYVGARVYFSTDEQLPDPLSGGPYYVVEVVSDTSFRVGAVHLGPAIECNDSGVGPHYLERMTSYHTMQANPDTHLGKSCLCCPCEPWYFVALCGPSDCNGADTLRIGYAVEGLTDGGLPLYRVPVNNVSDEIEDSGQVETDPCIGVAMVQHTGGYEPVLLQCISHTSPAAPFDGTLTIGVYVDGAYKATWEGSCDEGTTQACGSEVYNGEARQLIRIDHTFDEPGYHIVEVRGEFDSGSEVVHYSARAGINLHEPINYKDGTTFSPAFVGAGAIRPGNGDVYVVPHSAAYPTASGSGWVMDEEGRGRRVLDHTVILGPYETRKQADQIASDYDELIPNYVKCLCPMPALSHTVLSNATPGAVFPHGAASGWFRLTGMSEALTCTIGSSGGSIGAPICYDVGVAGTAVKLQKYTPENGWVELGISAFSGVLYPCEEIGIWVLLDENGDPVITTPLSKAYGEFQICGFPLPEAGCESVAADFADIPANSDEIVEAPARRGVLASLLADMSEDLA